MFNYHKSAVEGSLSHILFNGSRGESHNAGFKLNTVEENCKCSDLFTQFSFNVLLYASCSKGLGTAVYKVCNLKLVILLMVCESLTKDLSHKSHCEVIFCLIGLFDALELERNCSSSGAFKTDKFTCYHTGWTEQQRFHQWRYISSRLSNQKNICDCYLKRSDLW